MKNDFIIAALLGGALVPAAPLKAAAPTFTVTIKGDQLGQIQVPGVSSLSIKHHSAGPGRRSTMTLLRTEDNVNYAKMIRQAIAAGDNVSVDVAFTFPGVASATATDSTVIPIAVGNVLTGSNGTTTTAANDPTAAAIAGLAPPTDPNAITKTTTTIGTTISPVALDPATGLPPIAATATGTPILLANQTADPSQADPPIRQLAGTQRTIHLAGISRARGGDVDDHDADDDDRDDDDTQSNPSAMLKMTFDSLQISDSASSAVRLF